MLRDRIYEPSVIMCRKCVEIICSTLGVHDGSLSRRLRELKVSERIEQRLYERAEQLRMVGNDAAHDVDIELSKEDARDSLDFTEAILLYAFTLDRKFEEFRARRQQARLDALPVRAQQPQE
jgi:hypothetical protein